jgi:hypothetical protein
MLTIPSERRKKEKKNVLGKCNEFAKWNVRSKVHKFFFHNEAPTINKVLAEVNSDDQLPNFKRTKDNIFSTNF